MRSEQEWLDEMERWPLPESQPRELIGDFLRRVEIERKARLVREVRAEAIEECAQQLVMELQNVNRPGDEIDAMEEAIRSIRALAEPKPAAGDPSA